MSKLLSNFGKEGVKLGLLTKRVDIEDNEFLSKYFVIVEFNPILTAGRNPVAFNGSSFLKSGTEIQIECLDSNGNSLYVERANSKETRFSDVTKFVISIHVYNEIYSGPGKLIFVGTATKGETVRWIGNINIDKTLPNSSKVRFYYKPQLEVRPLLYPVLSNYIGSSLSKQVEFHSSFYTHGVTPTRDTNRSSISSKRTDIDYRLILNGNDSNYLPSLYQTMSFNTQMEGQSITINANKVQLPYSYSESTTDITQSFVIKKVLNSKTAILNDAFYYSNGKDQLISHISDGYLSSSYKYILYNTSSDAYAQFSLYSGDTVQLKSSYAEIVYRNLRSYSGFVARHKLYKKSLLQPGDYQLIVDEPLGATEILNDPVTLNKSYSQMGEFYNQTHVNKYWFTSSSDLSLNYDVVSMINSMKIEASDYSSMDGNKYVIVKADSSGSLNNANYVQYEATQFNNLSGSSYNSNFINLKKDALYVLSTNVVVEKEKSNVKANVSFYFTSSMDTIKTEKNYISQFGLKVGDLTIEDIVETKTFGEKQMFFFTPTDDYYGTIVIVPFGCNVTLSEFSLKVYGDYGFSPDILFTKIPFKISMANETFAIKSELFDINSNLVFSDLHVKQTFDPRGESLYVFMPGFGNQDPTKLQKVSGSLTVSQSLYLPNMPSCPLTNDIRLVGWHYPSHFPPSDTDGQLCTTNIGLVIDNNNDVTLTTYAGTSETSNRVLAVKYDGAANQGKKIVIDADGTKHTYP